MIVGSGQIATAFKSYDDDNLIIFASGVSDSNCTDPTQFVREKKLLLKYIQNLQDGRIVYFSSSALSFPSYSNSRYYQHKKHMEELIIQSTNNYCIFRVPQLFGSLKEHKTLINFLYYSILNERQFRLYDEAYRYVIEINDLTNLVCDFLKYSSTPIILNVANPYRYKVLDIVHIFEKLLNKKANYELIEKNDGYELDLSDMKSFIEEFGIKTDFCEDYLYQKLKAKV